MSITTSSQAFRRIALAGASVALTVAATGCGAGFDAQTQQPYQPSEGTNANSGTVAVRNMLVLADEEGKGELHAAVVNSGKTDDSLTAITAVAPDPGAQAATSGEQSTVKIENVKETALKAGAAISLPPAEGTAVTVTGAKPGQMIKVTITFANAGPITTSIPVLTEDHYSPSPRNDGEG